MVRNARVLVVDDDPALSVNARGQLQRASVDVVTVESGQEAIGVLCAQSFDLALIDLRLPDMSGLDILTSVNLRGIRVPWVALSAWMDVDLAVRAMRRGALNAVRVPCDIEQVTLAALRQAADARALGWPRRSAASLPAPKSAADRWVWLVLRGCDAKHDLKTIQEWAAFVGVGYRSLTETCGLVGIPPHEARDFMRILRALIAGGGRLDHPDAALNVGDRRTKRAMLARAGLETRRLEETLSFPEFLKGQKFVNPDHHALELLLKVMGQV